MDSMHIKCYVVSSRLKNVGFLQQEVDEGTIMEEKVE